MEETGSLPSSLGSEGTVERNSALGDWDSLSPPHYRPQTPAQPAVCTCPITQERARSQTVREVSILGQILAARSVESCQSALQPQLGSRPCQPPTLPPPTSFLEQLLIRPGCFRCCTRATGVWRSKPVFVGFTLHHSRVWVTEHRLMSPHPPPLRTVLKLSILQRTKFSETQDQDPNADVSFRAYAAVPRLTGMFLLT